MSPTTDTASSDATATVVRHDTIPPVVAIPNSIQHINKLTRRNFAQWRSHILAILNGLDLQGFVTGEEVAPPRGTPEYRRWFKQDQLILALIIGSLSEEVSPFASTAPESRTAWSSLHSIFASRSRSRVMTLKSELECPDS